MKNRLQLKSAEIGFVLQLIRAKNQNVVSARTGFTVK